MKAIELLKLYRNGLLDKEQIEIRRDNWGQKTVRYTNLEELEKEQLLQHKIIDWFIVIDRDNRSTIVINVGERISKWKYY